MTTRFSINLLRTGEVGGEGWTEWFVGERGPRRLAFAALAGALLLGSLALFTILPTYWRLASDLQTIPKLQKDLASADADLSILRSSLQALTAEAKRQVRWSELLTAFSQQVPAAVKLTKLEAVTTVVAPPAPPQGAPAPPGTPPPPPPQTDTSLKVESLTPVRPGSAALLEIAQFMAGLMRDPAVNRRFQLRGWEVKPPGGGTGDQAPMLGVSITLSERPQQ
jgi:hypothetical protein